MWLRNCWYVIAWDHEIPSQDEERLFTRKVLNEPIMVYRRQDGEMVAMADKCCHRHAPLSVGRREGDAIRCGYHGMLFDPTGRCIEIPGVERVPAQACVKTYPLQVKNKWVFVWMGEPERADPQMLPIWLTAPLLFVCAFAGSQLSFELGLRVDARGTEERVEQMAVVHGPVHDLRPILVRASDAPARLDAGPRSRTAL